KARCNPSSPFPVKYEKINTLSRKPAWAGFKLKVERHAHRKARKNRPCNLFFKTDRNSRITGAVHGCFVARLLLNEFHILPNAADILQHIVGGESPTTFKFRVNVLEILDVPGLVGIREHKVERTFQFLDELMRIPQFKIHKVPQPRGFQIFNRLLLTLRVNLQGGEPP